MPLIKSGSDKAFKANVAAEVNSGRPQKQALAIAFRIQRDAKAKKRGLGGRVPGYAPGGQVNLGPQAPPFYMRNQARMSGPPGGIIKSAVPGRSDQIPMSPKGGSYVIPADVVSGLGQGNTLAGANGLNQLFKMGPYGTAPSKVAMPRRPGKFADGGVTDGDPMATAPVDIKAAGGEFLVPPDKVAEVGGGDLKRGHDILDTMVMQARKKAIKTLKRLPGPKKR